MKTIIGALESVEAAIRRNPEAHPYQDHVLTEIEAIEGIASAISTSGPATVTSLSDTVLANGTVFEAVGIPAYIKEFSEYEDYGLTQAGWYVFAKIDARNDVKVTDETSVSGAAGYIADAGADHVDVAVQFGVAAESQVITVNWGPYTDVVIFRATDLAVRNLDYRTTFYIYDISPYATWEYALTTDATFAADKAYFVLDGEEYVLAEVVAGEAVPAYYTLADEVYTQATGTFAEGMTYYTKSEDTYTEAEVTVGEVIPAYYNHSKLKYVGMVANVTYKLDEMVDCPIEITLPEVADDGHGAWFEIQMRYNGSYSVTLLPPDGVKIGTAQTQAQTAGVNTIDLQYTDAGDVKMWTLLNTHSNIPTT